ncbi:MAG: Mrp/NBP35 family ATP-binding protein [Coriobacteriales bacterium]|jgi:Mrp family chromosome partitioning ATPase|nr:Mrp/NBP35 family ATP-binding protein [Coriobacteriales bacterium]
MTNDKLASHPQAHIKHALAVVSGKGGVGKSLVSSQLAAALSRLGHSVGVLDADITGPTMARAFGVDERLQACKDGIIPHVTPEGIKLVSTNMVLPDETTPVLWRGSIISNLVRQFWSEVMWDETDYLIIDMPPGTGDVALTIFQSLPIDGVVIVSTPQSLVSMIVAKAINMAQMMDVPVVGIVENMSYFRCPDCGSVHNLFGASMVEELAREFSISAFARVPIEPEFARQMDRGAAYDIAIETLEEFAGELVVNSDLKS